MAFAKKMLSLQNFLVSVPGGAAFGDGPASRLVAALGEIAE
jgi:hypothetical protein